MTSGLLDPVRRTFLSSKILRGGVAGQVCPLNNLSRITTANGATTVLAPVSTDDGSFFLVEDADGQAAANPITIDGNGKTIDGAASLVLSTASVVATLVLDGGIWRRCTVIRAFSDEIPVHYVTRASETGVIGAQSAGAAGTVQTADGLGGFTAATKVLAGAGFLSIATLKATATTGGIRFARDVTVYVRNQAENADLILLAVDVANTIFLGEFAANRSLLTLGADTGLLCASGEMSFYCASAQAITCSTNGTRRFRVGGTGNVQFGSGAEDAGGGVGVIGRDNASTVPTTDPTAGVVDYPEAGAAKIRGSGGTVTTIAPA